MPSITTWSRLEPRPRDDAAALAEGYAARIYDPLWLLSRQWQVGEFQGEDGGSPIVARWRGRAAQTSRFHSGPMGVGEKLDGTPFNRTAPLEAQVERRPLRNPSAPESLAGLRFAVDSGHHFLRLLARQATDGHYADAIRKAYPVPPLAPAERAALDPETIAFADLVAGRALDGRRLKDALGSAPDPMISPELGVADRDIAEVERACRLWLSWQASLFFEPTTGHADEAWRHERFEYAFSVAAHVDDGEAGERTLSAEQYDDGVLDWYSFDLNPDASLGARKDHAGDVVTRTVIPAPVTFHGMPAARFWEFEDARIDLGAIELGPSDVPQMLMIETLTGYGNDWFVIPIELDVGVVAQSRSLVITDTFGVRTLIQPHGPGRAASEGFSMFSFASCAEPGAARATPSSNFFYLPPTLAKPLEGPVLEEVSIVRDEMANLAWAIERRLESPLEQSRETAGETVVIPDEEGPPRDAPRYRLTTPVPAHWIPLIPTQVDKDTTEVRLLRGAVLDPTDGVRVIAPQARLLGVGELAGRLAIPEEEAPREGLVLRRSYQAARWIDGRLFVWAGNRASVGRGEGSSGLKFDSLQR